MARYRLTFLMADGEEKTVITERYNNLKIAISNVLKGQDPDFGEDVVEFRAGGSFDHAAEALEKDNQT